MAKEESDFAGSVLSHVHELAKRGKVIIISLLLSTLFFMFFPANPLELFDPKSWLTGFYKPIVSILLENIRNYIAPPGLQIISLQIGDPLEVYVFACILLGLVVSSPIIGYEVIQFINPAFHESEKKTVYPFVLGFTSFFAIGCIFGYLFLAPFMGITLIVFSQFIGAQPVITAYDFYSMIFTTILFTGFGFTFPVIFVLLVKLGIVGTSILTENRRIFYIVIYAVTAIITPDGGPLADLALAIPVLVMIEGAVVVAKRIEKKRMKAQLASDMVSEFHCLYCGTQFQGGEAFCRKCGKSRS